MPDDGSDPFLGPRDAGEERAAAVMREFLLREKPPERMYRQEGEENGYALVVPRLTGEAVLTVPALHQADFMYHGDPGTTTADLAGFISQAIEDSGADHLRIPLLSREQARVLEGALADRLPDWTLGAGLSSVLPMMVPRSEGKRTRGSIRRALSRARREGLTIEAPAPFRLEELLELHRSRWGPNRGETHFRMLEALAEAGCAELGTARTREGRLVAAQVDLLGTEVRYSYYAVSDPDSAPGCGTAVLGAQMERFAEDLGARAYSFGRGSERYKYQYSDEVLERFELRGFYAPCPRRA